MADPGAYPIRLAGVPPPPGGRGRSRGRPQLQRQQHTVDVGPRLTLPELRLDAARLFGAPLGHAVTLLAGFPPRPLADGMGDGEEWDRPVRDLVGRNESLVVRFEPAALIGGCGGGSGGGAETPSKPKQKAAGGGRKRSRPAADGGNSSDEYREGEEGVGGGGGVAPPPAAAPARRSGRAASAAATAAMPDIVREQERLMRGEKGKGRRELAAAKKKKAKAAPSPSSAAAAAAAARRMRSMPGRRLADGASVGSPAGAASPRRKGGGGGRGRTVFGGMGSEEDVSYALMSSLGGGGGGGGGRVGKVLRGAMRGAVLRTYEATRAAVRVDAVRAGKFSLTAKSSASGSASASAVGVSTACYSKGMEGRGDYEEEVEIIGLEALRAVVTAVHADAGADDGGAEARGGGGGREMLRPPAMAQLSPRVFWSLAHHFRGLGTEEALRSLLPDLDWSFLDSRSRLMSEKARENYRQEQVSSGAIPADGDREGYAKGVDAVEAVEKAMEEVVEHDRANARERAVRAALERAGGDKLVPAGAAKAQTEEEWALVTPTEVDQEELEECIGVSVGQENLLACLLIEQCGIRNWRELANVPDAVTIVSALEGRGSKVENLTESDVEAWIEAARVRSLEEIMLEIVDGNEEAFVALRDGARAGTPRDVVAWRAMPDLLLEEVQGFADADTKSLTLDNVRGWCSRAALALGVAEWLEWYATPIA